jgi:hypothetical protein
LWDREFLNSGVDSNILISEKSLNEEARKETTRIRKKTMGKKTTILMPGSFGAESHYRLTI